MNMRSMRCSRRGFLAFGAALAAAGHGRLVAAAEAGPEQPFDSLDLDWTDPARGRAVPVRLHMPRGLDGPHAAGSLPLAVISHGIGGSRRGYTWLGHHLARQGIAALHLQHVGSDRALWSGNVLALVGRLQDAAQADEAQARAEDWRFGLDTLLASELGARFDTQRLIAAGHSYGANTTLLVSGARVEQQGRVLPLADARVKAAIVISAPPFYGEPQPARILAGVTVPTLHVTATEDVIRIPGYWSGFDDRLAVFDAVGSARKWLAVYEGGSHSMFTDRAGTGGALNPQAKAATRELVSAFLGEVFDGQAAGLRQWPQRHAGILARFAAG